MSKPKLIKSCRAEEEENALHVSDGLSVHHQELETAYTATAYVKQLLLPAAIGCEMFNPYSIYAVLSS
jgi:hypothetical protein